MDDARAFDAVLEAARGGAEWAWADIYRDLAQSVAGYLRARGASDPEDLTGEVMLQVVRDLKGFEGGRREFRSWVFAVAHNRLLDDRRRHARRPVDPAAAGRIERSAGSDPRAEAALGRLEMLDAVRLLEDLTEDQQAVVLLRVIGDLSIEEVARITGRKPNAVKQLQHRALNALRARMGEDP